MMKASSGEFSSAGPDDVCQDQRMGDLATDTAVEQTGPSTFACNLSPDWEIWGPNGGSLDGLEHHTTLGPHDIPDPEALRSTEELFGEQDGPPRHPFWSNIEQRPTESITDWENCEVSEPSTSAWVRFVPTATFADPWVDSCRSLILIDLDSWPSATRAHLGDLAHFAPTIEVTARFIGSTENEPWLLSEASAPVASRGLVAGVGQVPVLPRQRAGRAGTHRRSRERRDTR